MSSFILPLILLTFIPWIASCHRLLDDNHSNHDLDHDFISYLDTFEPQTASLAFDTSTDLLASIRRVRRNPAAAQLKPVATQLKSVGNNGGRKCKDGNVLSEMYICDFKAQCSGGSGDNSDELNCGFCSFDEGNICGWTQSTRSEGSKVVTINSTAVKDNSLPQNDSEGLKGSYMAFNATQPGQYSLITPRLGPSSDYCRLNFAYYLNSDKASFKVFVVNERSRELFAAVNMRTEWHHISLDMNGLKPRFHLELKVVFAAGMKAGLQPLAFDFFNYTHCYDQAVDNNSTLSCSFKESKCNWFEDNLMDDDNILWRMSKNEKMKPSLASLGEDAFIFIERKKGDEKGVKGSLQSTTLDHLNDAVTKCLSFDVYVKQSETWIDINERTKRSYNTSSLLLNVTFLEHYINSWNPVRVSINQTKAQKKLIIGVNFNPTLPGFAAIRNIAFLVNDTCDPIDYPDTHPVDDHPKSSGVHWVIPVVITFVLTFVGIIGLYLYLKRRNRSFNSMRLFNTELEAELD